MGLETQTKKCYKIIRTKFKINKGLRENENCKKEKNFIEELMTDKTVERSANWNRAA